MYENQKQKLLSRPKFFRRLARSILIGFSIIGLSLLVGMLGYRITEGMNWIDSYLNAAMILSGMGPAEPLKTDAGKLFAGSYALFSGIMFLVTIAIVFAPILHRFFHQFHIEEDADRK